MRKLLVGLLITGSLSLAVTPQTAVAGGGEVAAGVVGGLAVGTLFGAAIASGPRYYQPAPVYVATAPVYIAQGVLQDRSGLLKGERAFVEKSFDQGGGDGAASNSRTKGKLVACAAVVTSAWRPRVAAVHDGARGHIQQAQPRIVMIDAARRR